MGSLLYRQRRILGLVIFMIAAIGATSLLTIGRQEDPTITNLFATVITPYPGADPARVEALVTEKIEEELREIDTIVEITSASRTGISAISIELSSFISDVEIEQAWSEIRDALSDAALKLPAGVPDPDFDNDRTGAYTTISAIMGRDGRTVPPAILNRYAELLQDRLRAVPGTELVRLFGNPTEEVRVEIEPRRLASLGLTATEVADAIRQADAKIEAGRVPGANKDFLIEVTGEIDGLDRIRAIPLVETEDGAITHVGDVADVTRDIERPRAKQAIVDGRPAVLVAARMQSDLQVDGWMSNVRAAHVDFEASLPFGIEHQILFDQSAYTSKRLGELGQNLLIGVGLVISVLLITLGWRAALVVAITLPLTALVSLAVLQKLGVPIHQMSVTGMIVALGLMVDAAIVMTDEIARRIRSRLERDQAIGTAVRRLAMPLLASTATTVFAFMPMAVLPGPAGDFVGSIATAVIVMLIASFLLALTVTPAIAGILLPYDTDASRLSWWRHGVRSASIGSLFAASLDLSLRYRWLAILAALILPIVGFGAFPVLTAQFFPGVERDQFYVQVKLPDGASLAASERLVAEADQILSKRDEIDAVTWVIGESAPSFYYNMMMNQDGVPSFAEALVTTKNESLTKALVPELQTILDQELPAAQSIVRHLVQGPPVAAPVEVRVVGPELPVLKDAASQMRRLMTSIPEVTHTKSSLENAPPKLVFDFDENKLRLAGLTLTDAAGQLDSLTTGVTGGSLVEGPEELPVRVRVSGIDRQDVPAIEALDILPPNARNLVMAGAYPGIPLSALGEMRLTPSESPIDRRNGERVVTVRAFLQLGVLPEEALATLQNLLMTQPLDLPPNYRIEYGGDSDARAETVNNLLGPIGLIVALMIASIVLTFNSYRLSLIAGLVALLSMGLSLLALAIFDYPFGIQALIGVIGSIGVSINAAIIIMTALQAKPDAAAGDPLAIRNTVMESSRHILSTTITTFGGFLPLILAGGGFWPPFAMAIAGGVLLSTIVSFYFVPPAFSLAMGRRLDRLPRTAVPSASATAPLR
ncbi:MAG: efflux RND transporter permease subunit [Pseudomonadota bacterium]